MQSEPIKKIKLAHKLTLLGVGLAVVGTFIFFATRSQYVNPTIIIGGTHIDIEIADSPTEKFRGLCCRDSLPENSGMLFVYDRPGNYRFLMRDTRIPLDMYWISSEKRIVHIEENVQPESYPKTFGTNKPSQYVLETNAGFASRHNIRVGDPVDLPVRHPRAGGDPVQY